MNKIKVLLVEDEAVLASIVKETLDARGFELTIAANGVEGWSLFNNNKPDVCVVDVMMPRKDGYSLVEDIRRVDQLVPIIFLTAKTQTADVIKGFEIGADDYMKKPFSMEELILRLKSLNRRSGFQLPVDRSSLPCIVNKVGHFKFDYNQLELVDDEKAVSLSQREADLLQLLLDYKNNLLDRKTALLTIWGDDSPFNARSMDVYITRLRKYLLSDNSVQILNIRGFGYKLIDQSLV
ncbi:response regulator transcription factor [Mucilaginibacter sp. E4BP6]|uniref:response regulator transcription factor n=1 Tax=Mucilaginibacter sp. E4BP6 TaxID=2723089 RepID=UPI0015C7BBC0|nr:response regulator transcription factor [Mucilaginibacter sp. E4BP6]NYE66069.1 DNA-binding response OmpR family regulator [Mucilaginibacter sp. E4BP6]